MRERLISEPIKPIEDSFDISRMSMGEPGIPMKFVWRDTEYEVAEVLDLWKEAGPDRGGSKERYLRKHWYHFRLTTGDEAKVYIARQPRSGGRKGNRWWLYSFTRHDLD